MEVLETYSRNLFQILKQGYNPYEQDKDLDDIMSVEQAFAFRLQFKEQVLSQNSYIRFKSRIKRFEKYLIENGYSNRFITSVDKKVVNQYLNYVLKSSSARNRNNTRVDIGSLFQVLEDNDIITSNFVGKIPVLKSQPKRNKTYTDDQVEVIYEYLQENDPQLLCFCIGTDFLKKLQFHVNCWIW